MLADVLSQINGRKHATTQVAPNLLFDCASTSLQRLLQRLRQLRLPLTDEVLHVATQAAPRETRCLRPSGSENRNLRLRIGGLNDITESASELESALKSCSATEFSACGWRSSARSSRKRTDEGAKKDPELSFSRFLDNADFEPRSCSKRRLSQRRCVQAWLLEKPAAWADADAASLAAADGPATSRAGSRGCAAPGRALPAPHR